MLWCAVPEKSNLKAGGGHGHAVNGKTLIGAQWPSAGSGEGRLRGQASCNNLEIIFANLVEVAAAGTSARDSSEEGHR